MSESLGPKGSRFILICLLVCAATLSLTRISVTPMNQGNLLLAVQEALLWILLLAGTARLVAQKEARKANSA
jgi:hypothetical protein